MPFEFDLHGWFAGGTAADGLRTVPMAPPSQSTTTTEGQPRANWNGLAWVMRPYVAPPPEPEPEAPYVARDVSRKAFLSRFTDPEAVQIDLASIGATVDAAQVRRYLSKVNAAQHIDLNDPETREGVHALEAVGLIAPGRALEILDSPIQSKEVP